MCGRFYIAVDEPELRAVLKELEEENRRRALALPPVKTGEVFPTDYATAITSKGSHPRCEQMRWGFSAPDGKGLVINARSETVLELPAFQKSARESRCLIPASYYFEWKQEPGLKKKTKHIMRDIRSTLIYLAGISRQEAGEEAARFVILTKPAARQIAWIHGRMPVILDHAQQESWLSPNANVKAIIRQSLDERIEGVAEE